MTQNKKRSRYRNVGGKHLIEIRVRSAKQLFDARDPAPFRARDLDDDFTEYIVTTAEEFAAHTILKLVIYVQEPESSDLDRNSITEAIRSHFSYQIELKRLQLTKLFKTAQLFLFIGLLSLFACLGAAGMLKDIEQGALVIFREGLIIFGWVSMWKPFELILFDWYPLYDKIRSFRKILESEIEIVFSESTESPSV